MIEISRNDKWIPINPSIGDILKPNDIYRYDSNPKLLYRCTDFRQTSTTTYEITCIPECCPTINSKGEIDRIHCNKCTLDDKGLHKCEKYSIDSNKCKWYES